VRKLHVQHNTSSITLTGHSLGAAIALLDAVYLPLHLPANTTVRMVGYGMPRVGNVAFADYVDASEELVLTHVNNRKDPVPVVPWKFLGYRHPSGEVHIQKTNAWVVCPGKDNSSPSCIVGDEPVVAVMDIVDHIGLYDDDIVMGICSL
jgi:predicted lipase